MNLPARAEVSKASFFHVILSGLPLDSAAHIYDGAFCFKQFEENYFKKMSRKSLPEVSRGLPFSGF